MRWWQRSLQKSCRPLFMHVNATLIRTLDLCALCLRLFGCSMDLLPHGFNLLVRFSTSYQGSVSILVVQMRLCRIWRISNNSYVESVSLCSFTLYIIPACKVSNLLFYRSYCTYYFQHGCYSVFFLFCWMPFLFWFNCREYICVSCWFLPSSRSDS